jgi:hypothetical protein
MMRDIEIALRFFALRHVDQYQRGMKGFLDPGLNQYASMPAGEMKEELAKLSSIRSND